MRRNLTLALVVTAGIILGTIGMTSASADPVPTPAGTKPAPAVTTTTGPDGSVVVKGTTYTKAQLEAWVAAVERHHVAEMWRKIAALDKAYKAHLMWQNIAKLDAWYKEQQRKKEQAYPPGQCGGDLPPCYVMMRESRGNIHAQNPRSTASGKWQFLDSTWGGYGGYAKARHAPERVQDDRARQLWAGGRGCSHWSAC